MSHTSRKRQSNDNLVKNEEVKHLILFCCLSSGLEVLLPSQGRIMCKTLRRSLCRTKCRLSRYPRHSRHARSLDPQRGHSCYAQTCFASKIGTGAFHSAFIVPCRHQVSPGLQHSRPPREHTHQFLGKCWTNTAFRSFANE